MNGKQAIDALSSPTQDVDLILTDIMMPEVDGMELMKIVQESDKPFRSIPIIIMSTVDSDEFKTKCGDAGATDYLVKPVRKQQMEALGRHASFNSAATGSAAGTSAAPARDAGSGQNQKSGGSNASADTAQGARGASPEEPSSAHEAEALGRGKRASRVADRKARREREEEAREAAEHAKAQAAKAKRAARDKEQKEKAKAAEKAKAVGSKEAPPAEGEGKQGQTGDGAGSGSGCGSGGSGSGAGEEPNVEGLSVQLVKAYGGATTMLELTLPKPQGEEAPKVGLRRSASRSAFQSFLNLEDAAAAQVISLKVDPEVAARAEGALASLAGIAAVAEEGTGAEKAAPPPPQRVATAQVGAPGAAPPPPPQMAAFFGMPGMTPAGMPMPPHMMPEHAMGMMPGASGQSHAQAAEGMPPGGAMGAPGMFPPCPPGVDPMLYARHMGAAASAATVAAASAGPAGSAAAASEFVSKFYSVLQGAVEHQQSAFSNAGAKGTCAKRRAEAIARYLKKRKDRNFEKKVRYASRKRLAEARPRIRGQFVRLKEGEEEEEEEEEAADGSEGKAGSASGNGAGGEAGSNDGGSNGGSKETSQSPRRR
jgi:CheY-like chemotaxis protein